MLIPARSIQGRRAPAPPTIASSATVPLKNATCTITPGVGGVAVDHYEVFVNGVSIRTVVSGFTWQSTEYGGGVVDVRAVSASGAISQASNTLRFTPASLAGASYYDADDASNTLVSGAVQQLQDLSGNGKHAIAQSSGARPPCDAEYLFSGKKVVRFGTAHSLLVTGIANPKFQFLLARPRTGATVGYCATSYGVGLVPVLRNNAGYNWGFQVSGTNVASVGAGFADEYFRPLALVDGGTGAAACYLRDYDSKSVASADVGTATDAGARQGNGLNFKFNDTTYPTRFEMRAAVISGTVPSADELDTLLEFCRQQWVERAAASRIEWIGTLATNDEAQPRPYPSAHNGVSGQSLQGHDWAMNGVWTGTHVTIGSAGDPGAGNRGATEAEIVTQAKTNAAILWFGPPAVETQNPDITVYYAPYERMIRRCAAIAALGPGSIARHYFLSVLPGLLAPYDSAKGALWNAWARDTLVGTLAGAGIASEYVDLVTDFDTGTMLRSGDQHLSVAGDVFIAAKIYAALQANGHHQAPFKLWPTGHSHVAGGASLTPSSTAQFRPELARLLSL